MGAKWWVWLEIMTGKDRSRRKCNMGPERMGGRGAWGEQSVCLLRLQAPGLSSGPEEMRMMRVIEDGIERRQAADHPIAGTGD